MTQRLEQSTRHSTAQQFSEGHRSGLGPVCDIIATKAPKVPKANTPHPLFPPILDWVVTLRIREVDEAPTVVLPEDKRVGSFRVKTERQADNIKDAQYSCIMRFVL